jgi:hypothetical protein
MPQLLTLPYAVPLSAAGILLPGSKLYFYQTGTSTPQAVYQGVDLDVAHSQPVESNGAGRFPAIYLDPSLPNYRILLTDSADVTQPGYPIDDVPSSQNTAQQFRLKHTAPELIFEETDASANNGKWRFRVNGEEFLIEIGNDAESSWVNVATLTRLGTFPNALNFAGQYLQVDGKIVATQESGSFTATLTGMTASTTGTVKWRRTGTKTTLFVPSSILGTSNSTSMTMTGVPSILLMTSDKPSVWCTVQDNGTTQAGNAIIQRSIGDPSSIVFGVGVNGNFTNSGSKGLTVGTTIMYDSDGVDIA